jgi:hypothetical protein
MAGQDGRTRARLAVTAELAARGWSPAKLAQEAGADPGTIGDFINGKRWIKIPTQGKIERALAWPAGSISSIEAGVNPVSVSAGSQDEPEFEFLTRVREDLTPDEMDQLMKEATPYLEMLVRDIKNRHRGNA